MTDTGIAAAELSHRWHREEHEHYVEPEWVSRRLFQVEQFDGPIHDPACGFGRIVQAAREAGITGSTGSDIVERGFGGEGTPHDFLSTDLFVWPNIVSNPPFDIFKEFALHALRVTHRKVALIWLVRTLPAARWLQDTPLARILLLKPRPSMPPGYVISSGEKPGGGKQDFCWLIFDHAHKSAPTIGWLHRDAHSNMVEARR